MNKCRSTLELAVRYVISHAWVDGVVIGFQNLDQAKEIVGYILKGKLSLQSLKKIDDSQPLLAKESLDPSTWGGS